MSASAATKRAKARKPATPASVEPHEAPAQETCAASFPIVGIGASAGGLEAFEEFFRGAPRDCGAAFVLVQHLDPHHVSFLSEILQRSTTMPVLEAQDQMAVAPNHVYVIPPDKDLAIFHGVLQVNEPEQPHGHRMPIDSFLRSLAEDQGERAIGVVLSGTGTDGSLGLRSILGSGGVSFVQEPASAKFDGMPSSAVQGGYATHVLPVEELLSAILANGNKLRSRPDLCPETDSGLRRILMLLRSATGHDFSLYKMSTIGRRIERRMSQHGIADTELYARYLHEHPAEAHVLFANLLVRVTSFFRDPEAFSTLKQDVLPELFAGKPAGYVFRAWVPGCATGEEAYSIAILLCEFVEESGQDYRVQIYATDIDESAITLARAGRYLPSIVQNVDPKRLQRHFVKDESGYRVQKAIREMVVFAVQSVLKDPPFSHVDLLSCRNVLIYVKPEQQDRVFSTFHFALKAGGVLFLSTSESIGNHSDLFAPLHKKWKLYRSTRTGPSARHVTADFVRPAAHGDGKMADVTATKGKEAGLAELADRLLLRFYAPASVMTDFSGNILHVQGETGDYLRPAPGKPTLNVVDMAHEELQLELRAAIHTAATLGTPTLGREVPDKAGGDFRTMSFSVRPVPHPDFADGLLLLSFQTVAGAAPARPAGKRAARSDDALRVEALERDLGYARETLRASMGELQATNEELQSTSEEMQSANEELQSANEELETSREELQSINEELVTVNGELQIKIEQLAGMQNDMKNLLDNISTGLIFLDDNLIIRHYAHDALRVFHLVPSDLGRPLSDVKSRLVGDALLPAARVVLETLVPYEAEVRATEGAWYFARIQPYRTLDNLINGVVLTFADITESKRLRDELRAAMGLAEGIVDMVREPLIVLDSALRIISASRSFYRYFGGLPGETVGRLVSELAEHRWDVPALRELLEEVLPAHRDFSGFVLETDLPQAGHVKLQLSGRRIVTAEGETQLILLTMEVVPQGEKESA